MHMIEYLSKEKKISKVSPLEIHSFYILEIFFFFLLIFNQIILFWSSIWCSLWSLAEPLSPATEAMKLLWQFSPQGRTQDSSLHQTSKNVPLPSERILICGSRPSSSFSPSSKGQTITLWLLDSQEPRTQTLGKEGGGLGPSTPASSFLSLSSIVSPCPSLSFLSFLHTLLLSVAGRSAYMALGLDFTVTGR